MMRFKLPIDKILPLLPAWLLPLLLAVPGLAAGAAAPAAPAAAATSETAVQHAARLQWWRDARFGMFIHWGPVSLKGTEISWSRANSNPACPNRGQIPTGVYDNLYRDFNPVQFDARAWVALARAAGMKYIVFTARHHDGFLMWHSKVSDHNISRSPFQRDVCAELAKAAHEAGMPIGWYFSPPDWTDPDFRTPRNALFVSRMQDQLRELLGNYGRIDILWFDWDGREPVYDQPHTYPLVKTLQPQALMTNRLDLGPGDSDRQLLSPYADFYTPEQELGSYDDQRPWETCMTIGTQWAWKPNDKLKPLKLCLQNLICCAGGDGNLLFNVGPMPSGQIEPRQAETLRQMGQWLAQYGESIYGTRGGPFKPWTFGASTRRGRTVYVHLFSGSDDLVKLPPLTARIVHSSLLTGGSVTVRQTDAGIEISVSKAGRQELDTVVSLELDQSAESIPALEVSGWDSLTRGKPATASLTYGRSAGYGAGRAVDGNARTRWATPDGTQRAWLEVDLGAPRTFRRALISEAFAGRVQAFELQVQEAGAWKTFYKGTTLGEAWTQSFPSVTARRVRLNILDARDGPTIWEFQLYD